jgi:tRNA-specific 2-thiouridylase
MTNFVGNKCSDVEKVVLGLSGGVDSLVSALLLKQKGYKVLARSFKLYNNDDSLERAKKLAEQLGIDFDIIDLSDPFKHQIIDKFVNDYIKGETPNPCVWCNDEIKAHFLYEEMIKQNAKFFATGHYIRINEDNDRFYIYKGKDPNKDQSYFLWNVKQKYLKHWLTPLGDYLKTEVKQIAIDHKMGFLAHRKESMSVCFLGNQAYPDFICSYKDEEVFRPGNICDASGQVLSQHQGLANYTIGQKKRLGLEGTSLCVVKMDADTNTIYVGQKEDLFRLDFMGNAFYFVDENDTKNPELRIIVRGIGINPKGFCKVNIIDSEKIAIKTGHPAWALAKGQSMAFYIGEKLVGGAYYYR